MADALVGTLLGALVALAQSPSIEMTELFKLKSDPLKYDRKIVQVKGWLTSGHIGVFVYDEAKQNSIRVRAAKDVPSISKAQLTQDKSYAEFWKLSDHETSKDTVPGIHVEFQAFVRVLKVDGKLATEFSVLGQFPIELVPVRVLAIKAGP